MNVQSRLAALEGQIGDGCASCRDVPLPTVVAYENAPPGYRPVAPPERRCGHCGRLLEYRLTIEYTEQWRAAPGGEGA